MSTPEPTPIEIAGLLITTAIIADPEALWNEIDRIARRPELHAEVTAHVSIAAAVIAASAKERQADPLDTVQQLIARWLEAEERDHFERQQQSE
jgi:hypothetical protein